MSVRTWIATAIVAPLIVGIILLKTEYSFFSKDSFHGESLSQRAERLVQRIEPKPKAKGTAIEPDLGNLETLFGVAQKIDVPRERNDEYVKLVNLALAENNPEFAFEMVQQIDVPTQRNAQYVNIVDKCLLLKRYSLALEVVDQIDVSTEQNEQYRKIIQAGSKERESATSSELMQPTAKAAAD